jgi:hypothetical protein
MTLHESSLRIILRDNFKGGFFMSEKMLVTQALDERDLLVKKISDKIDKASFVDTIKPNEDRIQAAGVEWRKSMSCLSIKRFPINIAKKKSVWKNIEESVRMKL